MQRWFHWWLSWLCLSPQHQSGRSPPTTFVQYQQRPTGALHPKPVSLLWHSIEDANGKNLTSQSLWFSISWKGVLIPPPPLSLSLSLPLSPPSDKEWLPICDGVVLSWDFERSRRPCPTLCQPKLQSIPILLSHWSSGRGIWTEWSLNLQQKKMST